jgi:enterochelin esterase-like enzyme
LAETSGHWSEEAVGGHPCDVFEPAAMNEAGFVVLFLHGVHISRLGENPYFTDQFNRHGLAVVSPITQRSWWTDRICAEFDSQVTAEQHVLENVMPYIEQRWGTKPPRVGLLGTSMGGQGSLRFAYKYPELFPVVAAISPAIDYQLRFDQGDVTLPLMYEEPEAARQDTATLHIHPLNWPRHQFFCCDPTDEDWFESSDRLQMKLASLGIPFECDLETEAGGHGFTYYNHMAERAVGFLVEHLEAERRRLV